MNQISLHISYLILTCRKVTVTGLGTFSASYKNASFDSENCEFYPSQLLISFSRKESDGSLLEDSLKRRMNVSNDTASKMVREYVDKVTATLKKNRYCRLEGIGYLIMDSKGKISIMDTFWKRRKFSSKRVNIV